MVVDRPVSVRDAVAELTTFVDTAGCLWGCVAADPARETKLFEKTLHPGDIFALVRVNLGVGSFEVRIRKDGGRSVSRPRDVDCVEVVLIDEAIEVYVAEALTSVRAPVAQQSRFDLPNIQRLM